MKMLEVELSAVGMTTVGLALAAFAEPAVVFFLCCLIDGSLCFTAWLPWLQSLGTDREIADCFLLVTLPMFFFFLNF